MDNLLDPNECLLHLFFVAYHPSSKDVSTLKGCLDELPKEISYSLIANDFIPGESVSLLARRADAFIAETKNLGYGRAANKIIFQKKTLPSYIAIMNTDLSWSKGTFSEIISWLKSNPDVCLAVPKILDSSRITQKLCKQNPTVLGLFSRRFIPNRFKSPWLRSYDFWYTMNNRNYDEVFESPYLSGCCMIIKTKQFMNIGGFDEQFFLYLEDADLTRSLSKNGRCVHLPLQGSEIIHNWGRGSHLSLRLTLVNIISAWKYFSKWGLEIW